MKLASTGDRRVGMRVSESHGPMCVFMDLESENPHLNPTDPRCSLHLEISISTILYFAPSLTQSTLAFRFLDGGMRRHGPASSICCANAHLLFTLLVFCPLLIIRDR
jgi:hypothetical protein